MNHVGAPLLHAGRFPLIEPAQVSPPESSVSWTRYVVYRVGVGVVVAMIGDPGTRSTGPIEDCKQNEDLFDGGIELECSMRKSAMICDCRAQTSACCEEQG